MKVFIWQRLENLTEEWHPEGGLVVLASSLERARELLKYESEDECGSKFTARKDCESFTKEPDFTFELKNEEKEMIFVFPDRGCC